MDGDFQSDLRMTYCASVVAGITNISFDRAAAVDFVQRCRVQRNCSRSADTKTWEGGYSARPGIIEAQGGTTYCATAALSLLNRRADSTAPQDVSVIRWILQRQVGGFQGRPGKLEDVCYSFWCGAALSVRQRDFAQLIPDNGTAKARGQHCG